MLEREYHPDVDDINDIQFPNTKERRLAYGTRNYTNIPGKRAIVDMNTGRTFALVSSGYQVVQHMEVIQHMDQLCTDFPEYGPPTREIWLSNYGGRMRARWTFKDIDCAIGTLPDGTPDTVHPTVEAMGSHDTSLALWITVGGYRFICSNGLKVGKTFAEYKRKHTASLDMEAARLVVSTGMQNYSEAQDMWLGYSKRQATLKELNSYTEVGFHKAEQYSIEDNIKKIGKVITWDDDEPKNNKVEITAWNLLNIFTEEASHRVVDITRQARIQNNVASTFAK